MAFQGRGKSGRINAQREKKDGKGIAVVGLLDKGGCRDALYGDKGGSERQDDVGDSRKNRVDCGTTPRRIREMKLGENECVIAAPDGKRYRIVGTLAKVKTLKTGTRVLEILMKDVGMSLRLREIKRDSKGRKPSQTT